MGIVTYFKVTPRKDRIASSAVYTLASFPSFLPLTPLNTPVFPRRFEQSEKKPTARLQDNLCTVLP